MDEARAREMLSAERARIERELSELRPTESGELAHGDQHLGDEASDLYDDEVRLGRIDDLEAELGRVEDAEARLAAGTYGISVVSGERIPDERLHAFPTADRTVEEAERLERG
jgi:RNA polymerase-binding transcription factor